MHKQKLLLTIWKSYYNKDRKKNQAHYSLYTLTKKFSCSYNFTQRRQNAENIEWVKKKKNIKSIHFNYNIKKYYNKNNYKNKWKRYRYRKKKYLRIRWKKFWKRFNLKRWQRLIYKGRLLKFFYKNKKSNPFIWIKLDKFWSKKYKYAYFRIRLKRKKTYLFFFSRQWSKREKLRAKVNGTSNITAVKLLERTKALRTKKRSWGFSSSKNKNFYFLHYNGLNQKSKQLAFFFQLLQEKKKEKQGPEIIDSGLLFLNKLLDRYLKTKSKKRYKGKLTTGNIFRKSWAFSKKTNLSVKNKSFYKKFKLSEMGVQGTFCHWKNYSLLKFKWAWRGRFMKKKKRVSGAYYNKKSLKSWYYDKRNKQNTFYSKRKGKGNYYDKQILKNAYQDKINIQDTFSNKRNVKDNYYDKKSIQNAFYNKIGKKDKSSDKQSKLNPFYHKKNVKNSDFEKWSRRNIFYKKKNEKDNYFDKQNIQIPFYHKKNTKNIDFDKWSRHNIFYNKIKIKDSYFDKRNKQNTFSNKRKGKNIYFDKRNKKSTFSDKRTRKGSYYDKRNIHNTFYSKRKGKYIYYDIRNVRSIQNKKDFNSTDYIKKNRLRALPKANRWVLSKSDYIRKEKKLISEYKKYQKTKKIWVWKGLLENKCNRSFVYLNRAKKTRIKKHYHKNKSRKLKFRWKSSDFWNNTVVSFWNKRVRRYRRRRRKYRRRKKGFKSLKWTRFFRSFLRTRRRFRKLRFFIKKQKLLHKFLMSYLHEKKKNLYSYLQTSKKKSCTFKNSICIIKK